jgi:hypothetical protein
MISEGIHILHSISACLEIIIHLTITCSLHSFMSNSTWRLGFSARLIPGGLGVGQVAGRHQLLPSRFKFVISGVRLFLSYLCFV